MEEGRGGKCSGKALSKDTMEGGTNGCPGKSSKQAKVGGQRHNKEATRLSQMGEEALEIEQSEDVKWLSALSHSYLDLLISLKELVILRAKNAGHEEAAERFDLRMLCALGSALMEYLKERIQNASIFPNSSEGFEFLRGSQFEAPKHEKELCLCKMALAEVIKSSSHPTRKRSLEDDMVSQSCKKPKVDHSKS